jgi:two-component system, NtrC family, sensor kinase
VLGVPLLRDGQSVGAITVGKREPTPFSEQQIQLLKTFADQAVIAIENVRLFEAEQTRTRELSEALEQQTATSEVLKVISSSPGELEPVFEAMLANAMRVCEAKFGFMYRCSGDNWEIQAQYGAVPAYADIARRSTRPGPQTVIGRIASTREMVQVADLPASRGYAERDPLVVAAVEIGGVRSILGVPLFKEDALIGAILLYRDEVRPFTDKQIALLKNFAAQAVIAIENTRLLNELRESLQQQTATSEVLKVISSSPGELEPVFNAMLANATRICDAAFGVLYRYENDTFYPAAVLNAPSPYADFVWTRGRFLPQSANSFDRMLQTKQVVHSVDQTGERVPTPSAKLGGARSQVSVPMLKDNELVGAILIYRQEVHPFTDKQIELVKNFAAQAVIAIENARLLNELRESLQQQTATSEVLKVISGSPGELEPVFNAMLEHATRICEATVGNLFLREGHVFRAVAVHSNRQGYDLRRNPAIDLRDNPGVPLDRVVITKQVIHIPDLRTDQSYIGKNDRIVSLVEVAGARTLVVVPMLKDDELIGTIAIYRQEVRPFTDKQIELVQNFAAQAVIAIENTRLLSELRQRTDDLSDSLERQTATAEILSSISNSMTETKPVFDAIVRNLLRLFGTKFATVQLFREGIVEMPAGGGQPGFEKIIERYPRPLDDTTVSGQAMLSKQVIQFSPVIGNRLVPTTSEQIARDVGFDSIIAAPMLLGDKVIGSIVVAHHEPRVFDEKRVALIKSFADQAVIAIENARLFGELRQRTDDLSESLQQQTATADVLKVISRSTFDLGTVLQTLVESAARLCDADKTNITRQKDGVFFRAEAYGFSPEFMDYVRNIPIQPDRGSGFGRALLERRAVHIPDVKADPEYTLVEGQKLGDYRTVLAVPMLREDVVIGVLSLTRSEVRPFSEKQIELATTFADQAAIAIENVRLFESVEARTRELAKSLEDLRTTQDRLVQTQKLASLGQLTAGIAHEIKNPLNFVNNFSGVSVELIDELRQALAGANFDSKLRAEISEIADTLQGNLDKVVQHGKRADAIVKNMLLHSREGSGEHRVVDINAIVEESLNLAYHGARAEKQGFNITMERSLDPAAGEADVFPQDITRALLNLISNGFYAATKRSAEGNGGDYEPTLVAATRNLGDRVEIRIRDNGTGMPLEVKEKIFNPFFTTKPAGEGTGLGLSISHDIIVKQHGGSIEVDTQPGEFTEITIILPRAAVFLAERT